MTKKTYRPLAGHTYHDRTDEELQFIIRDASLAAIAMRSLDNRQAEDKYLDQANDAATILGYRRRTASERQWAIASA